MPGDVPPRGIGSAFWAASDGVFDAREVIAAAVAAAAIVGPRERGDEETHERQEGAERDHHRLEHGEVDATVRHDAEPPVEEAQEGDARQPPHHARKSGHSAPVFHGAIAHDEGVEHEEDHVVIERGGRTPLPISPV